MAEKIWRPLVTAAFSLAICTGSALVSAQEPFYKGKTVRIIVGFPTGGGVDAEARLLARYLERYIPGSPTILVQNMPGAGGMVATNWFEQLAKPDGLTLHYTSTSSINQQTFGAEGVKFDLRGWEMIGSVRRGTSVAVIRPEKLDRLKGPANPLGIGTRTGDDSWNAIFLWGAEFLKWNVRWIMGYGGGGELRLAFQRGETDIYASAALPALEELAATGFQPFVQQGRLTAAGSFRRRPEFPAVTTFEELLGSKRPTGAPWQAYISWAGSDSAGRPLYAPPKTSREIVRTWRESFSRIEDDKDFRSDLKRVAGEDAELLLPNEAEPILRQLLSVTPEVRDFTNSLLKKYLKR
ncbi:MAG: Bug family tripartite tricarboxylate transporter substrate binding protein [Candidatus Binatia bacterium]